MSVGTFRSALLRLRRRYLDLCYRIRYTTILYLHAACKMCCCFWCAAEEEEVLFTAGEAPESEIVFVAEAKAASFGLGGAAAGKDSLAGAVNALRAT